MGPNRGKRLETTVFRKQFLNSDLTISPSQDSGDLLHTHTNWCTPEGGNVSLFSVCRCGGGILRQRRENGASVVVERGLQFRGLDSSQSC